VPDEYLSVAIGKRGQNVRLAAELTKWRLDVKSESLYSKAMKEGYNSLISLDGVGISLADALYEHGLYSAEEMGKSSVEELTRIRDITEEDARKLILTAKEYLEASEAEKEDAGESEEEAIEPVSNENETEPDNDVDVESSEAEEIKMAEIEPESSGDDSEKTE